MPRIACRRGWSRLLGLLAGVVAAASVAAAQAPSAPQPQPGTTATATFAGGCFWCVEEAFEMVPGVVSVVSGYTGGTVPNPTYEQVSGEGTGHAEAVRVSYDPSVVSYTQLVDWFWRNIDPTQAGGQFCDHGSSYRSAIFVHDEAQRQVAESSREALRASGRLTQPIVTEIVSAGPFYQAEDYHQDYYKTNRNRYRFYKYACGRAQRLEQLWGPPQPPPS